MMRSCLAAGTVFAAVQAWGAATPGAPAPVEATFDYHSNANVDQFRITHLDLDLTVVLQTKEIDGIARLEFKRLDPRATRLVLDTKNLMISDVQQKASDVLGATAKSQTTWVSRPFHLDKPDPILGSALVIDLPPSKKTSETIRIDYETQEDASALQWLSGKQTANKKPFLYTENEPIGARSWIPLQDTPQVRFTYSAVVHTDPGMRAVMSADNDPKIKKRGEFSFEMSQPVPSYLVALAVGDLEFVSTGPRTGVYAQKSIAKRAAKEFADTEAMIEATEKMFGPYRWNRYDILVMPASFPVGGMENPRLSFITPTVIAGDKSLVSVIAHELAHSWAGNLVGNATWRDVWLNEGFTDYMESRIMTAVYGEQRSAMEQVLGLQALRARLAKLPAGDQILANDLRDRDPKDVFTEVPYVKGRLFLNYLDAKFGREPFDAFLKAYFDHFAFKSVTTGQFLAFLKANLLDRFPGIVTSDEVNTWVSSPGLPADAVLPVSTLFETVDQARTSWLAGNLPAKQIGGDWNVQQWLYFLEDMPPTLSAAQLADLDKAHGFTKSENAEIASSWLKLVIVHDYQPAYPRLEEYLKSIGRTKLIKPLYERLMNTGPGQAFATLVFKQAKPGYHPETVAAIEAIVEPDKDGDEDKGKLE